MRVRTNKEQFVRRLTIIHIKFRKAILSNKKYNIQGLDFDRLVCMANV